ncbi:MAG: serine hydrolase, partial [Gluconobacter cerinus]
MKRRSFLAGATCAFTTLPQIASAEPREQEQSGWWALDLETNRTLGENPDTHLPMCSTFKWLLAAATLSRTDYGREHLGREIAFSRKDLISASPAVKDALAASKTAHASLSVGELCAATVSLSDSTAANLLLKRLGGPAA